MNIKVVAYLLLLTSQLRVESYNYLVGEISKGDVACGSHIQSFPHLQKRRAHCRLSSTDNEKSKDRKSMKVPGESPPHTHTRTHTHSHARTHTHRVTHARTHTESRTHARTHARTQAHTHTHTHTHNILGARNKDNILGGRTRDNTYTGWKDQRLYSGWKDQRRYLFWVQSTLRASLSGTFLQTLPDLVTPLKGQSLSPRSCPPTRSAPSERFGYL